MNRLVCVTMTALALMAAGSGCCCMDRYYYGDCSRPMLSGRLSGRACDGGACADGSCGPGGCEDGSCHDGGCADGSCGAPCRSCRPNLCGFNPILAIFNAIHCSSGCGEFYFDEWINDPPDRCDPCDECYGNYVGPRACPPRWWFGGRGLCGHRYAAACDCGDEGCGEEGCASCHGGAHEVHGEVGELPQPKMAPMMPEPMPENEARRPQPYYTPATRKASYNAPRQQVYSTSTRSNNFASPVGTGLR